MWKCQILVWTQIWLTMQFQCFGFVGQSLLKMSHLLLKTFGNMEITDKPKHIKQGHRSFKSTISHKKCMYVSAAAARGSLLDSVHPYSSLYYVCRPLLPPAWQRDDGDVGGRASIFEVFESSSLFASPLSFPPNFNWQSCHSQCAHSPVSPEAPPHVFSSHLSFLGIWWRQQLCLNLHRRHHYTTTRSFSSAWGHPSPLLQFYILDMMDNDDVVALFSLPWQPHSRINSSFSCISLMCWLAFLLFC